MKQNKSHLTLVEPLEFPADYPPRLTENDFKRATTNAKALARIESEFFLWFEKKHGTDIDTIQFSHLLSWAQEQGLRFTPEVFSVLDTLYDGIQASIRQNRLRELLLESRAKPFSWMDFFRLQAQLEKEEKAEDGEKLLWRSLESEKDKSAREENHRQQVSSALTFRTCSKDSAAVRDLDWLLTTNNIPSEEVQSVMQYLSELERMQPCGVLPKTGSRGAKA